MAFSPQFLPLRALLLYAPAFFLSPNPVRLLTAILLFLHPSHHLPLLPCRLPLLSPLLCQPLPRCFPYCPALIILWSCRSPWSKTAVLFSRLEWHGTRLGKSPEHLISLPSRFRNPYDLILTRVSCVYPFLLELCLWRCGRKGRTGIRSRHADATRSV
jgi:hypothetical protein